MWSSLDLFSIMVTFLSTMTMFPETSSFVITGASSLGCCVPCPPPAPSCDCQCGFGGLPQLPSLFPPFAFPQFPGYSGGGGGGAYATPGGGAPIVRQQPIDSGYLQQPASYQIPPQGVPNQQPQGMQGTGSYGFGVTQFEQQQPAGYATGLYGVQNGGGNFGDSFSSYSLPQVPAQNENRFAGPAAPPPPPPPVSGIGQYVSGPPTNLPPQPESLNPPTYGVSGVELPTVPVPGEYTKKNKAFMKVHKS